MSAGSGDTTMVVGGRCDVLAAIAAVSGGGAVVGQRALQLGMSASTAW